MRAAGRIILGLALVIVIAAAGLYGFRTAAAGYVLRTALTRAGFENVQLRVTDVTLSRLRLADMAAGADPSAPQIFLASLEAGYDWRALIRDRRVQSVHIGPGGVAVDIDQDGAVSLAGFKTAKNEGQGAGAPAPFDSIAIDGLDLVVRGAAGGASGMLSGGFDFEQGGALSFHLDTERYAHDDLAVERAALDAAIELGADGAARVSAIFAGDLLTAAGAVRGFNVEIEAGGASWRAAAGEAGALSGEALVEIHSADFASSEAPALSDLTLGGGAALLGEPVSLISVAGAFRATFKEGRLTISGDDAAPLKIVADNGAVLTVESVDGAPLAELDRDSGKTAFRISLTGGAAAATGRFSAASAADGVWRFDMDGAINEYKTGSLSLGRTALAAKGAVSAQMIDADVSVRTIMHRAAMGQFEIDDTAIDAPFRLQTNFLDKRLTAEPVADRCIQIAKTRLTFEGQSAVAALDKAQLCRGDAPFLAVSWDGATIAHVAGLFSAAAARYRIGDTLLAGAPPRIDFDALYASDRSGLAEDDGAVLFFDEADALFGKRSEVRDAHDRYANSETGYLGAHGRLKGGRVVVNNVLVLADMGGVFEANLDSDGLTAESLLQSLRVSQAGAKKQVEPVIATGVASLAADKMRFNFDIAAPGGALLGTGAGVHDMISGKGEASFDSGLLIFSPVGLQPAKLISAIYGTARDMSGAAAASARVSWGKAPEAFQSAAEISLEDIEFRGPGLAVSKTGGLNGDLKFSSLAPLTTGGPQTVSLKTVDLDALKLENGEIIFEMPGDETLLIHHGEFPWFGGRIGVYDATASLSGDKVTAPLRAVDVDLSQLLGYLEINSLSGEGVVEGVLPLIIEDGKARIENGELSAVGPGVIRYTGDAVKAAAATNENARMAFDLLRELHFDKLTAKINGALDGDLDIRVVFEGTNDITLQNQSVASPIIYRISIEAPLLALIDQARVSTDFHLQYERLKRQGRPGQ